MAARDGARAQRAATHRDHTFHHYGDGTWKLIAEDGHTMAWGNEQHDSGENDTMTDSDDRHEQAGDVVPRCQHGRIILACDDDTCPEQNAYLAAQNAAMDAYDAQLRANARAAFGLVERKPR